MFQYLWGNIAQLANALQFSFGGKAFCSLFDGKLKLPDEVSAFVVKPFFSLSYGEYDIARVRTIVGQ